MARRGRLRALNIQEERTLAGRVAGLMYVVGATTGVSLLFLPGIPTEHWRVTVAAAFLALGWGALLLFVVDWERALPALSHFSTTMGYPLVAVVAASTGGANSPARFYLFFTIFFAAYFYPLREALPHFFGCLIVEGKALLIQLRDAERELSRRDPLTDLANRRALMSLLEELTPGERAADSLGLVLVDLDDFKSANTIYGHPGGDRVLCEAGRALTAAARDGDLVARLGGDEFAIACPGMTQAGLEELGERVLAAMRDANEHLDMPEFRLGASVGTALYPADAALPEGLIAVADRRLGAAKAGGRGRAVTV